MSLFIVGAKFGVNAANNIRKFWASITPPTSPAVGEIYLNSTEMVLKRWNGSAWVNISITPAEAEEMSFFWASTTPPTSPAVGEIYLNLNTMVLQRWNGSAWVNIGITPAAAIHPYNGVGIIDQNNDFEFMVQAPNPVTSATMKLVGLNFLSCFYTDYPGHSNTFLSTLECDDHTHDGSVAGNTGDNNQNHDHDYWRYHDDTIQQTGQNNQDHTHYFSKNFTTDQNQTNHRHSTTVNFPGSTQKSQFSAALLQVFISTNRGSWGSPISIDVSALYNPNGTGHIDISSYLTAGVTNYIRFHLNTATVVGGQISYLIQLS